MQAEALVETWLFFWKQLHFCKAYPKIPAFSKCWKINQQLFLQQTIVGIKYLSTKSGFFSQGVSFILYQTIFWDSGAAEFGWHFAEMLQRWPIGCQQHATHIAFVGNIVKWIEMIDDLNEVSKYPRKTSQHSPSTRSLDDWGLNVETDCGCTTGNACEAVVMMVHHLEFPIEIVWQWGLMCVFYFTDLVKVSEAFAVVGRCKFLLAMALQKCKVCSFIVALIFMLVPFRHRRWSSHRGIWATTSTSSRCVKRTWTQRSEYIFLEPPKKSIEIHHWFRAFQDTVVCWHLYYLSLLQEIDPRVFRTANSLYRPKALRRCGEASVVMSPY